MNIKKFQLTIIFYLFSALIFSGTLSAEDIFSSKVYSLSELEKAMNENNPELQKLQMDYEKSLLDVKDAKAGLGPVVDLQVTGTYMFNPPVDSVYLNTDELLNSIQWPSGLKPSTGNQYVKIYDGMENTIYNFQLSVMQPVFTWGKLTNAVKLYKKISSIKQIQILSQQEQLHTELKGRLIALHFLNEIMSVLDEEESYAARLVTYSEDAEKSGMLIHQDVVEAKIQAKELQIARQDLIEQQNNLILELQRATGIETLSLEQIDLNFDDSFVKEILSSDKAVLEEKALRETKYNLQLLTQLKEVNELSKKIASEYVNWKPDVALQMSLGYGGSRVPLAEPNWLRKDDYSANISIGIKTTVWDGGKKLNDVARKKLETKTADINKLDATSTIKQTLSTNWNKAQSCQIKIEYQDLKIESAQSKIAQKETIYASGYGSESDVLNAKIDLCNEKIEKLRQSLTLATSCITIDFLTN